MDINDYDEIIDDIVIDDNTDESDEASIVLFVRDEIEHAIDSGFLKEISEDSKKILLDKIINDDYVWNGFDDELREIFIAVNNGLLDEFEGVELILDEDLVDIIENCPPPEIYITPRKKELICPIFIFD